MVMIKEEKVETPERVIDRIHKYLPSKEKIEAHPSPSISQTELREELKEYLISLPTLSNNGQLRVKICLRAFYT